MQQRQEHTGWYFSVQWSGNFHQHETEQERELIKINTKSIKLDVVVSDEAEPSGSLLRFGSHLVHEAVMWLWNVVLCFDLQRNTLCTFYASGLNKERITVTASWPLCLSRSSADCNIASLHLNRQIRIFIDTFLNFYWFTVFVNLTETKNISLEKSSSCLCEGLCHMMLYTMRLYKLAVLLKPG